MSTDSFGPIKYRPPDPMPVIEIAPILPRATQSQSPLMQLPAEIRVMVLRELLISDEPVGERKSYERPGSTKSSKQKRQKEEAQSEEAVSDHVRGYRLYPSLLAACQNLLTEGFHMLYSENTLPIRIQDPVSWYDGSADHKLLFGIRCLYELSVPVYEYKSLLYEVKSEINENYDYTIQHPEAWTNMNRFGSYIIELAGDEYICWNTLRDILLHLASVTNGKTVKVKICLKELTRLSRFASLEHTNWIKAFQLLRCRNFHIFCTTDISQFRDVIAMTEEVVTGSQKVQDLYQVFTNYCKARDLLEDGISSLTPHNGEQWAEDLKVEIEGLNQAMATAAMSFDTAEFFKLRRDFLAIYDQVVLNTRQEIFQDDQAFGADTGLLCPFTITPFMIKARSQVLINDMEMEIRARACTIEGDLTDLDTTAAWEESQNGNQTNLGFGRLTVLENLHSHETREETGLAVRRRIRFDS